MSERGDSFPPSSLRTGDALAVALAIIPPTCAHFPGKAHASAKRFCIRFAVYLRGGSWIAPCIPGAVQVPFLDTYRLCEWIRPRHGFGNPGGVNQGRRWRVAYLARVEGSLLTLGRLVLGWLCPGRSPVRALHRNSSASALSSMRRVRVSVAPGFFRLCSLATSLDITLRALRSRALIPGLAG